MLPMEAALVAPSSREATKTSGGNLASTSRTTRRVMPLRVLMLALLAPSCCSATSPEARTDAVGRFRRFTKALAACEPGGTLASSGHLDCIIGQVEFRSTVDARQLTNDFCSDVAVGGAVPDQRAFERAL